MHAGHTMTAAHRAPSALYESQLDSPIGTLHMLTLDDALCWIGFGSEHSGGDATGWRRRHLAPYVAEAAGSRHAMIHEQLLRYFDGRLKKFRVKTQLLGTDFQLQVWTALRAIAYGNTVSYQSIADAIGNPKGSRAVGQAVGRNPISIIIPCHRVIGEHGSLVGYAGGIDRKKFLLQLEGALLM